MDPISLRVVGTLGRACLNLILRELFCYFCWLYLFLYGLCVGYLDVSSENLCTCNLGFWCYLGL